ncbi:hypothetical protein [Thiolapillus sp.]
MTEKLSTRQLHKKRHEQLLSAYEKNRRRSASIVASIVRYEYARQVQA